MAHVTNVGVLFADIAGSTRLYETLGDTRAHEVVDACLRLLADVVIQNGGIVTKTIGDEIMATFDDPACACAAAIEINRRTQTSGVGRLVEAGGRIAIRIGFQFGPAVRDGADVFGDCVNVASRLATLAKANQILTTAEVLELLSVEQRAGAAALGQVDVRGRAAPVSVVKMEWEEQPGGATILQLRPNGADAAGPPGLRLVYRERSLSIASTTRTVTCGREPTSDIVLSGPRSSRAHATIERRHGRVVLIDHSSNGTYLYIDNREPLKLHRDEGTLLRQGTIRFGAADGDEVDQLHYVID